MKGDPYSLDRLQDIVRLEPVSWWPPAQVWLFVIAIGAIWTLYAILLATYRWLQNAYRRQAERELLAIDLSADGHDLQSLTLQVARTLKRVALVAYPREKVASLSGDAWLRFLNDTCEGVDFLRDPVALLGNATHDSRMQPVNDEEFLEILMSARIWIASHRAELTQ